MLLSARRSLTSMTTAANVLEQLGLKAGANELHPGIFDGSWRIGSGDIFISRNPANNQILGRVGGATVSEYDALCEQTAKVRKQWAELPAPLRGEAVRRIGNRLREKRDDLGALITMETGKILAEGIGEVQEAIDMCDFACGLSRMLNGKVIPSERPGHFMMERYLPLTGNVAIISAFNFPVAVFFWNAALSLVTGNTHIWKPADTVPLCGIASARIIADVLNEMNLPAPVSGFICGSGDMIGNAMVTDPRNSLVSFTGSTKVGKIVSEKVASRLGRSILELGGNNAMIVMDDADVNLALNAAIFAAVGTAGQRCTTLRRLIVHQNIYDSFLTKLVKAVKDVRIGDPLDPETLCGPLHTKAALQSFLSGIEEIKGNGGRVLCGGIQHGNSDLLFVKPTIIDNLPFDSPVVQREIFAPILYVFKVNSIAEAISVNNSVPQGLSSSVFTKSLQTMFEWVGPHGSDCGIVNVNIGTSGAEIGGAFGGDKDSGGGREAGSDIWKSYCRRVTCTINHSESLPLAQGIVFKAGS